jgi:2,3-bisphosphoglycerate-independent phosphoglycerate mutase
MNNPPEINRLWREYPHKILQAFGALQNPYQKVGNSEIGHASIGAGTMINQDLVDISFAIDDGSFFKNGIFIEACREVKEKGTALHLLGMISDGGVHSHIDHLFALLKLAKEQGVSKVFVHAILDGVDTEATTALSHLVKIEEFMRREGVGKIATVHGRFYALDRDNHWDRIALSYRAMVAGIGHLKAQTAEAAVSEAYRKGYTDFTMPPAVIVEGEKPLAVVQNGDAVIFWNARADRARQLTRAFVDKKTGKSLGMFRTLPSVDISFITITDYKLPELPLKIAFPHKQIQHNLGKIFSDSHLKQLRVAESEKYAHVTYFFNGGREEPYPGEDRAIVPSKRVASYDQVPEMSAKEITKNVLKFMDRYDFMLVNFANVDIIGHTGNILAAGKAIQTIDASVKAIVEKALPMNAAVIITADHGNAEQMIKVAEKDVDKVMHTLNPVPFILVANDLKKQPQQAAIVSSFNILSDIIAAKNTLADIAPTVLELFGLPKAPGMTGESLIGKLE